MMFCLERRLADERVNELLQSDSCIIGKGLIIQFFL